MSAAVPGEDLRTLVRSGWRLLVVETFEEDRALSLLQRVGEAIERRVVPWSVAAGLDGSGEGAGSLDAGLRAIEAREGISGVNLDEEAINLTRFQQAYQAAAQVISTADTLFQSLLAAVRR